MLAVTSSYSRVADPGGDGSDIREKMDPDPTLNKSIRIQTNKIQPLCFFSILDNQSIEQIYWIYVCFILIKQTISREKMDFRGIYKRCIKTTGSGSDHS